MRCNKLEEPYRYYKSINPTSCEPLHSSANKSDDVIWFPIEPKKGSKFVDEMSAIDFLKTIKMVQENWVVPGKTESRCIDPALEHNVSNTVRVADDEWEEVTKYVYENRKYFTGISFLSRDGDLAYEQAPQTRVLSSEEIIAQFGAGAFFASGIIEGALRNFSDRLWVACNFADGTSKELEPANKTHTPEYIKRIKGKRDWIRSARKFADNHFGGDRKKMAACLKRVWILKKWEDVTRDLKPVDWSKHVEEADNTKVSEEISCSGGSCRITRL